MMSQWSVKRSSNADRVVHNAHRINLTGHSLRRCRANQSIQGLTGPPPNAKNYSPARVPDPGRHHVGIPGDIIPEFPGGFVGIRTMSFAVTHSTVVAVELCAEVGDGMKGIRRRIVGVFDAPLLLHRAPWATANSRLARATMPTPTGCRWLLRLDASDASLTADNDPQQQSSGFVIRPDREKLGSLD